MGRVEPMVRDRVRVRLGDRLSDSDKLMVI